MIGWLLNVMETRSSTAFLTRKHLPMANISEEKHHDSKSLATKLSNLHFWRFFFVENSPQSSKKAIAGLRQPRVRLGVLPPQKKTKVLLPHGHILILWIHVPLHRPNFVVPYGLRSAELIKTYENHLQVPSVWILKGPSSRNKIDCWGHTFGVQVSYHPKKNKHSSSSSL